MELSKNFEFKSAEQKWYKHWLDKKYFHSEPDAREPHTVVIPPPNVTGVLHMGHCLNNTIQDILVRRARMNGKNACWVPGTDHASIATEAKVVQMLREKGIQKASLSREEFLKYAWEWKEKYGGIILDQLKKLGCSLDWERTSFTMDDDYYKSVIDVFCQFYQKGYIYRGKRMIHWDVKAKTALSDEEVIRKETQQKLYFLNYKLDSSKEEHITIATVRPETIMGDTAICVHPNDERFKHLHGKFAFVPLINRRIPIITDEYVTMEFGTGALKITPAHDVNDHQLGLKHKLEIIDIFNEDGTLNASAKIYIGEDRFVARKKIVSELQEKGIIEKIEDYTSEIGFSERTDAVVEPRLSLQWWVDMKKISSPALTAVLDDEIKFYPGKFKNLYRHWMENIKDWCISRQLWWGHRIPAWYTPDGNFTVAATKEEALQLLVKDFPKKWKLTDLKQDEDCLDTWFSSWLWPSEVFKGMSNPNNADFKYYYPTNTLVTAPEIIFFWVARMIMAGYEFKGQKPFNEVYFTGIVRDKQGRKMSKSLGNSPDLLALIDTYGADAIRFGIMISSPAGNDLLWDESSNVQGRNFTNKMWNALKLIKSWEAKISSEKQDAINVQFAIDWFENRLTVAKSELEGLYKDFKLSEALKNIYSLIWDDFCSWYLEWVKPGMNEPVNSLVYQKTIYFFEELMHLLHPFMPFITEDIYHLLSERKEGNDLTIRQSLPNKIISTHLSHQGQLLQTVITTIRDSKNSNKLFPKDAITLSIQTEKQENFTIFKDILAKQVNASVVHFVSKPVSDSITAVVQQDKFFITTEKQLDKSIQKEDLLKELNYQIGFLGSVEKKLNNDKFVNNANPEIINSERKKKSDAEARIKLLQESIATL
ncbi:MAG: valine--tRNA ligase [Chitinophagaceae bacterium]|nr:MAG: valine--tRNA ligase [Chitinophagaceae bacterium]